MSILTKEGIQKILNDDWLLMDDCEGLENCTVIKELARMALAAMDSEPVAWTDEEELRDANAGACGYLFGIDCSANKFADPRRQIMLYRHAQPAPVVPNGLRLALSNAGIAAPESDEMLAATCEKHIQALVTWVKDRKPFQSAPVVPSFEEWLSAANRKPLGWVKDAMREAYDAFRAAMLQAGNSPVIPDGWVACSERLPDETQPVITVSDGGVVQRTVYQFCEGVWSDWYEQYDDVTADAFTHWMPLPAAPQEVKGE